MYIYKYIIYTGVCARLYSFKKIEIRSFRILMTMVIIHAKYTFFTRSSVKLEVLDRYAKIERIDNLLQRPPFSTLDSDMLFLKLVYPLEYLNA